MCKSLKRKFEEENKNVRQNKQFYDLDPLLWGLVENTEDNAKTMRSLPGEVRPAAVLTGAECLDFPQQRVPDL